MASGARRSTGACTPRARASRSTSTPPPRAPSKLIVRTRERYSDGVDALLDAGSYAPGAYDAALKDGARVASTNNAAGEGPGSTNAMALATTNNASR